MKLEKQREGSKAMDVRELKRGFERGEGFSAKTSKGQNMQCKK